MSGLSVSGLSVNCRPSRLAPILIALTLALAAGAGCDKKTPSAAPQAAPVAAAAPSVAVKTADIRRQLAPRVIFVDAPLAGLKQADVYAKVVGRLTYLGPKEGEAVKAGDLLFRIDRSDPGESFLNMPTVSPLTGWVGMWRVTNVGEQVTPTEPVVTIVDDRTLRVVAYVPADDWTEVAKDTKVTATLDGKKRLAKVVSVARSADLSSGRGSVTVEIPNPKRDWRAGMFAQLRFELQPQERLLVSAAALIITDQGAFVYLEQKGVATRAKVQYRVVDPDTVEITSGLPDTARIVIAGANLLSDHSRVRIVE